VLASTAAAAAGDGSTGGLFTVSAPTPLVDGAADVVGGSLGGFCTSVGMIPADVIVSDGSTTGAVVV
jgi:hypothetical protein